IKNNATFTLESGTNGLGFMRYHRDWTATGPNEIVATNGGKIELVGTGKNVKILEVTGNMGMQTDFSLTNFTILNAKVLLGEGSKIVSQAMYTQFDSVEIAKKDAASHKGIYITDRWNVFRHVDITGGEYGFTQYVSNISRFHRIRLYNV